MYISLHALELGQGPGVWGLDGLGPEAWGLEPGGFAALWSGACWPPSLVWGLLERWGLGPAGTWSAGACWNLASFISLGPPGACWNGVVWGLGPGAASKI